MRKKILAIIILCLTAGMGVAKAQYDETNNLFYHTFRTPQSNDLNAAFFPTKNTMYLRLPSLGMQMGFPLSLSDMASVEGDSLTVIDLNRVLDNLSDNNRIHFDADYNVLGFGLKVRNIFFTLNLKNKTEFNFGMPVSIINALRKGNVDADGYGINNLSLMSGDLLNFQSYFEQSIGVGLNLNMLNLTLGARAKILVGLVNIQTDNTRVELHTDSDFEELSTDIYYEVRESSIIDIDSLNNPQAMLRSLKDTKGYSWGKAFDIGAKFKLGPFNFSLALNDLSRGIHWQQNCNSITPVGGQLTMKFDGQDISSLINGGQVNTDDLVAQYQALLDGIVPEHRKSEDYWYSIPTKMNIGANVSFLRMLRAGILFHGQFDRGLLSKDNVYQNITISEIKQAFRYNATVSLGANIFNRLELIVGSSLVHDGEKYSFFNPGAGIILTPGSVVQTFVMADYVSSIYLAEAKAFNVRFGMNVLIGKGGHKSRLQN